MGGVGAIAGGLLGAFGGYKDAKAAKKAAAKGSTFNETTTRTPYGPAQSHIDEILNEAKNLYNQPYGGPAPYAWQNFLGNPQSPGAGADPTYGGRPGWGGGGGGGGDLGKTWKGKDKAAVRKAKQERQDARTASRNAPGGGDKGGGGEGGPGGPDGKSGGPQFKEQEGPFGYSKGIREFLMDQYQGQGAGGYQPALQYITALLGGQNQNPMLGQAMNRVQQYQPGNRFSKWLK